MFANPVFKTPGRFTLTRKDRVSVQMLKYIH